MEEGMNTVYLSYKEFLAILVHAEISLENYKNNEKQFYNDNGLICYASNVDTLKSLLGRRTLNIIVDDNVNYSIDEEAQIAKI